MDEIIKSITEAEEKAAEIKLQAEEKAAEIITAAEKKAAESDKKSENDCRLLREMRIKEANEKADKQYAEAIAAERVKAKKFADGVIKYTDNYVAEIVGRLSGGNR